MSVIKIAGNNNGTTKGITVNENGYVNTVRNWNNTVYSNTITQESFTGTDILAFNVENLESGIVSLRIYNLFHSDITIAFMTDTTPTSHKIMFDGEQLNLSFGRGYHLLTPEICPALNYLTKIRVYLLNTGDITVESGDSLQIDCVVKS